MNYAREPVSDCCGTPVRAEGNVTMFYRCSKCLKPCNPKGEE